MYVSVIGTENTAAQATANIIEKFLKSNFVSVGLPAVEVFLLFSFYRIGYASMHDRTTHMHDFPKAISHFMQHENNPIKLNQRTRYDKSKEKREKVLKKRRIQTQN